MHELFNHLFHFYFVSWYPCIVLLNFCLSLEIILTLMGNIGAWIGWETIVQPYYVLSKYTPASLGNGGVGSSRSSNGFKKSSSSVDWLGTEMVKMKLRDNVDHDSWKLGNL